MKFAYVDLSDDQFEKLIVFVCQEILGRSTIGFSSGADGGRDAKFVGTAELHPSKADPWVGTVIIQAKHTNAYNKRFSEGDFFDPDGKSETIISKEIPRIKNLRDSKQLDHYMLFSNRRLAANAESEIRAYLSEECGIPVSSIYLCGVEQLEMLLKRHPEAAELAEIDPIDSPLIVSPDELALVVMALASHTQEVKEFVEDPPTPRLSYNNKNKLNKMTPEYAKSQRKAYLKDTAQIQKFLADPINVEHQRQYEIVVDEFNLKIIAKQRNYQKFDDVMEYLAELLFGRDVVLRQNKKLTRTLLFYMYWNCDLGKTEDEADDAETE